MSYRRDYRPSGSSHLLIWLVGFIIFGPALVAALVYSAQQVIETLMPVAVLVAAATGLMHWRRSRW
ncbi:MAG: hypothetical protein AAGA37_13825 [Actinomycetota bacterium]